MTFQYAIEHGIPFVHPDWILESHTRYIDGEDIDVNEVKGLLLSTLRTKQYLPGSLTTNI